MSKRRPEARAAVVALAASAPVFAALGDPTRLRLVARLGEGAASIARLTEGTSITRQAVTKHLRVLQASGLAHATPSGREQVWSLDAGPLDAARRSLELASQRWDERLARLKALVEE